MKIQVLVSTMNQSDHSLIEKMNIQSDAIIVNQCNKNEVEEFKYKGNKIKFLSFAEKGVGLSRNNALMRASADICLFADDDVKYINNYNDIISEAFENNLDADVIVFNVPSTNLERQEYIIPKYKRVRFYNCLRYGTFRIAIRTESIRKENINFSLLFGGGAKYSSGEDSLFMMDCIKNNLKIYACPEIIGSVAHNESTWFKGYTDKYFFDKGVFFAALSKRWGRLLCLLYAMRRYKVFSHEKTLIKACSLMISGVKTHLK
ncbi:glycosyltransferase family 2 protein [Paenibacillus sp. NPDC058367]|uniref:glycosyltransferase family A protein n=1 Tax=Paenibacillus sp. NPDC058367 TaxID=3346460 RepID=UPI003667CAA9